MCCLPTQEPLNLFFHWIFLLWGPLHENWNLMESIKNHSDWVNSWVKGGKHPQIAPSWLRMKKQAHYTLHVVIHPDWRTFPGSGWNKSYSEQSRKERLAKRFGRTGTLDIAFGKWIFTMSYVSLGTRKVVQTWVAFAGAQQVFKHSALPEGNPTCKLLGFQVLLAIQPESDEKLSLQNFQRKSTSRNICRSSSVMVRAVVYHSKSPKTHTFK